MQFLKRGNKGPEVKELQKLLQKLGYYLQDDGDFGKITEAYVKKAQKAISVTSDGRVGETTWTALKAVLATFEANRDYSIAGLMFFDIKGIDGLYPYTPGANSGPNERGKWATKETIEKLKRIGKSIKTNFSLEVGIGDISLRNGGPYFSVISPERMVHQTHRNGDNVDFRPIRKDRKRKPVTYTSDGYDQRMTEKLILALRDEMATLIYFNDPYLTRKYTYVRACPGHGNHLHAIF